MRPVGIVRAVALVATTVLALGLAGASGVAGAEPTAYVTTEGPDQTCTFGRLDLGTGTITTIGTVGGATCAGSLTFAPDGTLFGLSGDTGPGGEQLLVRYDLTTGVAVTVGTIGVTTLLGAGGLAFDRAGSLWLYLESLNADCSADFSCLYRIDPTNAATTFVGGGGNETIVGGLAGLCDGRVVTARGVPPQQLAAVDTASGALGDLGPLDPDAFTNELATEADGTLWALASPTVGDGTVIQRIDPNGPTVVSSRPVVVDPTTSVVSMAIAPLTCPAPVALPAAPTFTG